MVAGGLNGRSGLLMFLCLEIGIAALFLLALILIVFRRV